MHLAEEIADLQEQIDDKDHRRRAIAEGVMEEGKFKPGLLPELLKEIGIRSFTLADDTALEIGTIYRGSIKDDNREIALAWLRDNGFGAMIKNEFKLAFGKDEDAQARKLAAYFAKQGLSYDSKEGVHHSTLNAFIKDQTEKGRTIPDCLGPFITDVAKVVNRKVKKTKGAK